MADQIIYDNNGNFQCISRTNADGSTTSFCVGPTLWPDYIAQNGIPPPTGAPTYPPPAPSVQTVADLATIANFKGNVAPNAVQQLQALQAFVRLKG